MKICHVISSIDNSSGGPPRSVTHLLKAMGQMFPDDHYYLHTYESDAPIISDFKEDNIDLLFYNHKALGRLKGLESKLLKIQPDILHGQGIWELPMHQMVKIATKRKIPYVITPRGMLESWSLSQRKIKKKIAMALYQYKDLREAACLHATAQMEADSIRALGLKNPIAIIPNGVPLEDFEMKNFDLNGGQKKILFLSRIHEKKGIEFLIEAWAQLSPKIKKDWVVDIVGNGEIHYINQLRKKMKMLNVANSIKIHPPLYGSKKLEIYHEANLFVLPTYSENFGVVIAEALACGTPVITTKGAPWEDLNTHNCGNWIEIGTEPLLRALEATLTQPSKTLEEMGRNGRKLVEEKYSIQAVSENMHMLYYWLLGSGSKPNFVI